MFAPKKPVGTGTRKGPFAFLPLLIPARLSCLLCDALPSFGTHFSRPGVASLRPAWIDRRGGFVRCFARRDGDDVLGELVHVAGPLRG